MQATWVLLTASMTWRCRRPPRRWIMWSWRTRPAHRSAWSCFARGSWAWPPSSSSTSRRTWPPRWRRPVPRPRKVAFPVPHLHACMSGCGKMPFLVASFYVSACTPSLQQFTRKRKGDLGETLHQGELRANEGPRLGLHMRCCRGICPVIITYDALQLKCIVRLQVCHDCLTW